MNKLKINNYIPIIRAHHLLCLQSYKGKGYNPTFITFMDDFIQQTKSNPNLKINLIKGKDDFCCNCFGQCVEKGALKLDDIIIKTLRIKDKGIYLYSTLVKQLHKIMTPEKHKEICGGCWWWNLCKNTFKKND